MLKVNLKFAFRQLQKNKVFSFVNIIGLSLSMVACLLIYKYVSFEKSYDNYHTEVDKVYRVYRHAEGPNGDDDVASIFPAMAPTMKENIPEIIRASRFIGSSKVFQSFAFTYVKAGGESRTFNIPRAYFADDDAIDIFGFDWKEGRGVQSLNNPNELVISRSFAERFFGQSQALGKILRFKNMEADYKVTGVFEDFPENSHFKFDMLCSMSSLPQDWELDNNFGWGNFYTYVRVTEGAEADLLGPKIDDLMTNYDTWYADEGIEFKLQPIKGIHLDSNQTFEIEANGNRDTVNFLSIIGLFIMIIAWVNYINLSTSKLVERAKEVGVRKVMGSYRRQLVVQFLMESILVNVLAIVLSLTVLQLTRSFFESLIGIPVQLFSSDTLMTTLVFIGFFTLGAILFGLYPAVLFSRQKAAVVLKGRSKASKSGLMLRRGLTVFQYVMAVALILGTVAVKQQLQFMQNQSLGMNIDQTLIVKTPFIDQESRAASRSSFVNQVNSISTVEAISGSSEIPGYEISRMRWVALGPDENDKSLYAKDIAIDNSFIDLYDIEVLYGRNFSQELAGQPRVILSLSAAEELLGTGDLESWINRTIYYETEPYQLVGIVNDISQESIKNNSEPHIYTPHNRIKYYSIKLTANDIQSSLTSIEQAFNESFQTSHFDYFFLDEYFNRQYKSDRLFGQIFSFFSVLAIIITALGLFGLSLYNISQRTKEVGIRKVLGASVSHIFYLLTKEYLVLLMLASLIALPLGYYIIDNWLNIFANRMSLNTILFVMPVILVAVLTLLTVCYQVIKAIFTNPADTLRYE